MYECNTGVDCKDCTGCETNLETTTNPDIGYFMGTDIDFAVEYHRIRKLMGTKGTDLDELYYNTMLMYVSSPDKWTEPYFNLIHEISTRKIMLDSIKAFGK